MQFYLKQECSEKFQSLRRLLYFRIGRELIRMNIGGPVIHSAKYFDALAILNAEIAVSKISEKVCGMSLTKDGV